MAPVGGVGFCRNPNGVGQGEEDALLPNAGGLVRGNARTDEREPTDPAVQPGPSRLAHLRVESLLGRGPGMAAASLATTVFLTLVALHAGHQLGAVLPWTALALLHMIAELVLFTSYKTDPDRFGPWRWELLTWIVVLVVGQPILSAWAWLYMPWDDPAMVTAVIAVLVTHWIGTIVWLACSRGAYFVHLVLGPAQLFLILWIRGGTYQPLAPLGLLLGVAATIVHLEYEMLVNRQFNNQLELERLAAQQSTVFDTIAEAVVTVEYGRIGMFNARFLELIDRSPDEVAGRQAGDVVAELGVSARLADGRIVSAQLRGDEGGVVHVAMRGRTVTGHANHQVWVCVDETERLRDEQAIRHLAARDDLTGMLNRRALRQLLDDLWHASRLPVGLLLLDLDGFKAVNDRHGHEVGDLVLRSLAVSLSESLPECTFGRLGGDEFVCVVHEGTIHDLERIADIVCMTSRRTVDTPRGPLRLSSSVGVTGITASMDRTVALRLADEAMYRAKRSGGNTWVLAET